MIELDIILSKLYADQSANQLKDWLTGYDMMDPIKRTVSQLNLHLSEQNHLLKQCKILPIGHIASNLLVIINTKIATEKNPDNKGVLENTLSDIAVAILTELFKHLKYKDAASKQIMIALKDTCEMFNYDYSQLLKFLKPDSNISYLISMERSERASTVPRIPSYIWKGKESEKATFISLLSERKLFLKKKGIALLFEKPNECLNLVYNKAQIDLALQFFASLKKYGIVTHTGCDGFYKVLGFHIMDFENVFLKNQKAGGRLNALKQSKARWLDNQRRINKWLTPFIS